jgi:hypothetical protein
MTCASSPQDTANLAGGQADELRTEVATVRDNAERQLAAQKADFEQPIVELRGDAQRTQRDLDRSRADEHNSVNRQPPREPTPPRGSPSDAADYFCDPHAPWRRGIYENTNGLLRQYFPKGSDLSVHTAAKLDWVAAELDDRPRKRLGFHKPIEQIEELPLR